MHSDVIATDRLTLRRPAPRDAAQIAALVNTLEIARWLTHVPHPYSIADAEDFIGRFGGSDRNTYFICLDGVGIGMVGLESELGYWLGTAHWGQGYAPEASAALIARHFKGGEDRIRSGYFTGNDRSRAVLERLGFIAGERETVTCRATGQDVCVQKTYLSTRDWRAAA